MTTPKIAKAIKTTAREYQIDGIEFILDSLAKNNAAYLADEMGLGKTYQAMMACGFEHVPSVLVVCPASLRLNWMAEYAKFQSGIHAFAVEKAKDLPKIIDRVKILNDDHAIIVSYALVAAKNNFWAKLQKSFDFDVVIFDEAHYLKSIKAQRTKVCIKEICREVPYKIFLSGTPAPNSVVDVYPVFATCAPQEWGGGNGGSALPSVSGFYKFAHHYTNATKNYWGGWKFEGARNMAEMRGRLDRSGFLLRRTKAEVAKELPPKILSRIPIKLAANIEAAVFTEEEVNTIRRAIESGTLPHVSEHVASQRRGLGILKVPEGVAYIKMLMQKMDKLVVFTYHREVNAEICEVLKGDNGNFEVHSIIGGMSAAKKHAIVEGFQEENDKREVLVAQLTAAGVGINLTQAHTCVFAELDWVPANMAQAMDRLHRIGAKHSAINVHFLIAENTLDSRIIFLLEKKIKALSEMFEKNSEATENGACN